MAEEYGSQETTFTHPITGEETKAYKNNNTVINQPQFKLFQTVHPTQFFIYWVMDSHYIFIGDTDNLRLDWLKVVQEFPQYKFRIYRTYKGFRVFILNAFFDFYLTCESKPGSFITYGRPHIHSLFESFQCDTLYTNQCWYQRRFAARLTPKPNRYEPVITQLVYSDLLENALPEIQFAIATHDGLCFNNEFQSCFDLTLSKEQKEGILKSMDDCPF